MVKDAWLKVFYFILGRPGDQVISISENSCLAPRLLSFRKSLIFQYYLSVSFFLIYRGCLGQLACTSTNPTGPEINDHVSFQ